MEVKNYFATDTQGNVLGSAQVYLYLAGTTTLATGLQNISGAALANPFTSSPTGLVQFKAPDDNYDLRVVKPGREFTIRIQCFDGIAFMGDISSQTDATKGASMVAYVPGIPQTNPSSVAEKLRETPSVVDFMTAQQKSDFFAKTGLIDQTSAINKFWQYIKSTFVDLPTEDYVKVLGEIPAGEYRVDGSVNFTNLKARNSIISARGAVFVGRGSANNTVDITGTRWVQIDGLTIVGDQTDPPKCGLLMGPQNQETSGNNVFWGVNVTGYFLRTAVWNIGSETTTWFRGRAVNYNQDPTAKAYIADGKMRMGATSAYASLRSAGVGVSFTNNQHYACDIRNHGGGAAVWAEFTRGWGFDRGCYFVSYNDSIFELYQSSSSVHQNISIEGLMETTFKDLPTPGNTGCKHQVKFIGDGTDSILEGFVFKVGVPHTALSSIKQDSSVGAVTLTNADIVIGHQLTPDVPIFDAPTLTLIGRIQAARAIELNVDDIASFTGQIITYDAGAVRPAAGTYMQLNAGSQQMLLGGSGPRLYDGIYRGDGAGSSAPIKMRGKGAGNAEIGNEALINALTVIADSGAVNGFNARAAASGTSPRLEAFGPGNDIGIIINPKGTAPVIVPLANVRNFADDAAAATGGIPVGGIYRTANALKIRIS